MTKQEEIKRGIRRIAEKADNQNEKDMGSWEHFKDLLADELLTYLHSQGVVIKVERKTPRLVKGEDPSLYTFREGIDFLLRAGYVAAEPLIKEDSSETNC